MILGNINTHDVSSVFVPYTADDSRSGTTYWFMTSQGSLIKERFHAERSGCVVFSYSLCSVMTTNRVLMDV